MCVFKLNKDPSVQSENESVTSSIVSVTSVKLAELATFVFAMIV